MMRCLGSGVGLVGIQILVGVTTTGSGDTA